MNLTGGRARTLLLTLQFAAGVFGFTRVGRGQVDGVSPLMAMSEVPAIGIRDHATIPIQV
ncbi:MAG: hypothetical protein RL077_2401 [Verrucomicrobiota bacterium]